MAAVRVISWWLRRALVAARRGTGWRILTAALGCAAAATAALAWLAGARGSEPVSVERTTSTDAPPVLTDAGPPPGPLLPLWKITTPGVPGQSAPGGRVGYGVVDGQLVIVTAAGLDVRDARTGGPRWHYYPGGLTLAGWAVTGTEIAAYFEHSAGGAGHTLLVLDAATGQTLWHSQRYEPVGEDAASLRWLSGPGVFLVGADGRGVRAVSARGGRTEWSRPLPAGCLLAPAAPHDAAGDGAAVDVVPAVCRGGRRVIAVSPADGRVLWSLSSSGATADSVSVRHGVSALWDGETLRLIRADGRTLLLAEGDGLCGDVCPIAVAAGRVLLNYSPDALTWLLRAVDLASGRLAWQQAATEYQAMADAGGRVYALSDTLGGGLLPAAADIVDPVSGQRTSVPLPLAFRSGASDQPWLAAGGGLLIAGYPLEFAGPVGGYRVVALRSAPAGPGPAVLGGVAAADWPDTCTLVSGTDLATAMPGYARVPGEVDLPGLRLRAGCEYEPGRAAGDAAGAEVSVGWVAASPAQAASLLADVLATYQQAEPLPGLGDEAYDLDAPAGPVAARVGRVIIMVRADGGPGAATELARAAVRGLRRSGY